MVSIGNEVYLAIAKGGLTDDNILITPMEHHPSSHSLPTSTYEEVAKFKAALKKGLRIIFLPYCFPDPLPIVPPFIC